MQAFMPPGTVKSERRKKSRKRPPGLIYVEFASGNGGMMRDLNADGFAVRAMLPLRVGEITQFSFSLNDSIRVEGEGEILWIEENGRVAGVRFTQIPSTTRVQIQEWLNGPEATPMGNETAEKSVAPPAPSFAQLREEIHSVSKGVEPPAIHAVALPSALETVPLPPPVIPSSSPSEYPPPSFEASAPVDTPIAPVPEAPSIPTSIPVLPPLPEMPKEADSPVESVPAALASVYDTFVSPGSRNPFLSRVIFEDAATEAESRPDQPDISEILMQPGAGRTSYPPHSSPYARLDPAERLLETPQASWTEWFTLSRAVTIMILLTLVVAAFPFHKQLGNSLIWLGEQMGGTPPSQSREVVPDNTVPAGAPNGTSSNPSDIPSQQLTSTEPAPGDHQNAGAASALSHDNGSSLSTAANSSFPPVSPLSDISTPGAPNNGQETGQTEYLQAMQLLRGKNAVADRHEAVRLLWISVEKGNPGAELALADMYWHGQGVARNCDQTRILLSAAARKGSAEAQKRLKQFQREGCE
jgi:PilZ domain-containing protein